MKNEGFWMEEISDRIPGRVQISDIIFLARQPNLITKQRFFSMNKDWDNRTLGRISPLKQK